MKMQLKLDILPQPDNTTCGPTCLHAVYRYFGDDVTLDEVIRSTPRLADGGTLAALLGTHALDRGYQAILYTYNLQLFDPTWFRPEAPPLDERLRTQLVYKDFPKFRTATEAYLSFLDSGGQVFMEELTRNLLRRYLHRDIPILAGLSATYLYQCAREYGSNMDFDDIRGVPMGHFVVLYGYDKESREVHVADPLMPNPMGLHLNYTIGLDRLMCAIMLGILTYDGNLLIIQPDRHRKGLRRADSHRS